MQVLENAVPIRTGQLVELVHRSARIACPVQRPGGQQRRGKIGHRTVHRLAKVLPGERVLLLLEFAHPDHQPRDAIGVIDLKQSFGKLAGFIDVAVAHLGEKRAVEQIGIARIGLQYIEIKGRRGAGIALDAGLPCGQIIARRVVAQDFLVRWRLRRASGSKAQHRGSANDSRMPIEQRVSHVSSIGRLTGGPEMMRPKSQAREWPFWHAAASIARSLGANGGEIAAIHRTRRCPSRRRLRLDAPKARRTRRRSIAAITCSDNSARRRLPAVSR